MYILENRDPKKINLTEIPNHIVVHGQRVGAIAFNIAEELNYSHSKKLDVALAGLYHDYGKIWVKDSILNKPGPLTDAEMEEMRLHALYSSEIVRSFPKLRNYAEIILYHHEYIDGSGYNGLKGKEIPEFSKILTVADVYDALVSDRVYRKAFRIDEALRIMEGIKHKYDPRVLEALFRIVEPQLGCACCTTSYGQLRKVH